MAPDIAQVLERWMEVTLAYACITPGMKRPRDRAIVELYNALVEARKQIDALKVTWVRCEERMPDTPRDVWVHPFEDIDDVGFAPIASWSIDEWWGDDRPLENPGFTYWAEIVWPPPPQKEGGGVREA